MGGCQKPCSRGGARHGNGHPPGISDHLVLLSICIYSEWRCPLSHSLTDLEATRSQLLQQFLTLGDFRPGTVSATSHRCGKPSCHCAQPGDQGHPQFRLLRKINGKSVGESFSSPAAFRQAADQTAEFHRLQDLVTQLTAVNEQICRLRPAETAPAGWTEQEKKRLSRFIKKSRARSRRFSN